MALIDVPVPTIPVSELFGPVIQGEGMLIGRPTVFVRTGGCDYHCSWCDSLYAVEVQYKDTWTATTPIEIINGIQAIAPTPILITLSGGNPALQRLGPLIAAGHVLGYTFAIETQGSRFPEWAYDLDYVTLSPKPPSSDMMTNWGQLERWLRNTATRTIPTCLKVVVFDDNDFEYAGLIRKLALRFEVPLYLQAGTSNPYGQTDTYDGLSVFRHAILQRTDWLSQKVIEAGWYEAYVLCQLHALIHGAKRGV